MKQRINDLDGAYSVGQLAKAAGLSVRSLHHYDHIGLLSPQRNYANGYRVYGRSEALRLQEILLWRDAGMALAEIAALLKQPQDRVERLSAHRARLMAQAQALQAQLAALDQTIAHLKGDKAMTIDALYSAFAPEKQAEYEDWLVDTYGSEMAAAVAKARTAEPRAFTTAQADAVRDIERALVQAMVGDQTGAALDPLMARHRAWVAEMWGCECAPDAYGRLADIYLGHPDFIARFEALAPGFSQWLTRQMRLYAARA
ncbi:MAG: MerR family transcriptional regulator [Rhodobacteraceae bacterium]|nr:MerR family transcriptional regulator [Paracoccaceae bacterium]